MSHFQTINPYNQQVLQSYSYLEEEEINNRLEQSNQAYHVWRKTSYDSRAALMRQLAQLLKQHIDPLAKLMTQEMGKPLAQAVAEINKCCWVCEYYAENAAVFLSKKEIKTNAQKSWIQFEPLGIILGIMPWNFPFWQAFRFAIPTVMAGNCVIVKHAPSTFGSSEAIQALFEEAGFPKHVYSNFIIDISQVERVISHPFISAVSLTGSEKAGQAVSSIASRNIKKSVLELGGSNAFIVLEDADIGTAVDIGIEGRMQNNGQSCIAAKRFLVHRSIYQEFTERFASKMKSFVTGDPMKAEVTLGPLARIELAEKLELQIQHSIRQGARLILGGGRNNAFVEPTILTEVIPGMPAFDEELFGPVAAFTAFDKLEEAIQLSNQNNYGLGVSLFTTQPDQIIDHISEFEEGAVFINEKVMSDPRLPFGGVKNSGIGRELGEHGLLEFVNVKTVYLA